jgi:hypothetical protein
MRIRAVRQLTGMALLLASTAAFADGNCDPSLLRAVGEVRAIIDSLHTDALSRVREVAADGSLFTASEASWFRQELGLIGQACQRGAEVEAAWRTEQLLDTLTVHAAARHPPLSTVTRRPQVSRRSRADAP